MKGKKLHNEFMSIVDSLIKDKLKNEPLVAVILGGSVARGDETEHSDIDICFYVKERDLPKESRSFYKFKEKYIEEHYLAIESLNAEKILPEEKILYDKTGELVETTFDKIKAGTVLSENLHEAKKYLSLAKSFFEKGNYEMAFYHLYSLESPASIIMHSLPPAYNLPFPSFRLLKSIAIIDRKEGTNIYKMIEQLYSFGDINNVFENFEKGYRLMGLVKRTESSDSKNLGFFSDAKINYNLDGLKKTFKDYPPIYSYRFIFSCLAMWAFDKKIGDKDRLVLRKYLLGSLGLEDIDKDLIEEKLKLSSELIKECDKIL